MTTQHQQTGTCEMQQVYERALAKSGARGRYVELRSGRRVHLIEAGEGAAVVHLHGTSPNALSHLPLLERMTDVRSIAVDRPGNGLSEPATMPRGHYREAVVEELDEILDALGLATVVLAGASGGGLWSIWYALARPERVSRLVLLGGTPLLPGTKAPPVLRVSTAPVIGGLLNRLVKPSRANVIRFMRSIGEAETIVRYPDLLDSLVAARRDPVALAATMAEFRALLSPTAPGGMRPEMRLRPDELHRLSLPTLLVWGDREPLGGAGVAAAVADMIPGARLEMLPAGHVPWLGHPDRVSQLVSAFAHGSVIKDS
jgi:pimeloyl-ACP methyl ester carboxylesterase